MTAPLPAALYARVSTDEQAEHGTSLDGQLAECRSHAAASGSVAFVSYVDAGISGTLLDRPALSRMREDARAGRIGQVVCFDPDRLSRNLGHLLFLVDEFRQAGVGVEFANFTMSQSPDGRLLFAMRGAIAEFETHKIRQRMTAGKLARAREGRPVGGGHQIFGYIYDKAAKRFVPDPVQASVVRHVFALAESHGTYAIASLLNGAGLAPKRGGTWSQTSVHGILRNRTYLGRMPQMNGAGSVVVPPLVDVPAWERAQSALAGRRNRPAGPARHPYLLTGRLRCGVCGRRMGGGYGRSGATGYLTRYACSGKRAAPRCPSSYYRSDRVDEAVWQAVRGLLIGAAADAKAIAARVATQASSASGPAPVAPDPPAIERQRERVWQAYRTGLMDEATLRGQLAAILAAARLAADETRLAESRHGATEETVRAVVRQVVESARLDERRLALDCLGAEVTLGPGHGARLHLASGPA